MDFAGAFETLVYAQNLQPRSFNIVIVGPKRGRFHGTHGCSVTPDETVAIRQTPDVLIVPGGPGVKRASKDRRILRFIKRCAEKGIVAGVSTGALLLEEAGLLDDKRTAVLRDEEEYLDGDGEYKMFDERVVVDGRIITSCGSNAGFDLALHLVGKFEGPELVGRIQGEIARPIVDAFKKMFPEIMAGKE